MTTEHRITFTSDHLIDQIIEGRKTATVERIEEQGYLDVEIAEDKVTNFVCTLKFQAETDHDTTRRFAKIPGSRVVHLHHNKHELTWFRIR